MFQLRTLGGLDLRNAEESKVTAVLAHAKRAALLVYLRWRLEDARHGATP